MEARGKRRLHERPSSREIAACRPWLDAELCRIRPDFLILLGATAAHSVLGSAVRVQRDRGVLRESELCRQTMVTIHPSALLRLPDEAARAEGYAALVKDLKVVARAHQ